MAKNIFRDLKAANRAQARILRRDTRSDFKVTQQGLDAIMGNLLTTQQGLGRKLNRVNRRSLDAMQRISDRSDRRMDQIVNVGQNIVDKRYGTVVGSNPELFRGTKRVARSQGRVNRGQLRSGELQMRGANEAMDILAGAAQTAADAGNYELAQALRERQTADAETIAASRLALQQQKADALANERYLRLQTRLANGGSGGAGLEGALAEVGALAAEGVLSDADLARLALQYNLGPQAVTKLRQVAAGYGTGEAAAGSPAAQAFTEAQDQSPAAALPDEFEAAANKAVWKAFDPNKQVPTTDEALHIIGVERDPESGKYMDGGQEVDEVLVQAAIAYVQSTWMRIAAKAGA